MTQAKPDNLWVSQDEYDALIEQLALKVFESGFKFDQLLCLARGGLRVGDVLSRVFKVPLAILATSSYRAAAGTEQGKLNIAQHITTTAGELQGKLLLVDDMVDSGATFAAVSVHLLNAYPLLTEIKTAVLWQKASAAVAPDFVVSVLVTDPWIHQPFEAYDTTTLADLAEKWRSRHNKWRKCAIIEGCSDANALK